MLITGRLNMSTKVIDVCIDWTGCDLVERVPGEMSCLPIVRGTRILADAIVQDAKLGSSVDEIQAKHPDLSLMTIRQLLSFAHAKRTD